MEDYAQYEWGSEGFEDVVARALIACFEAQVTPNLGAPPWDRLGEDKIREALKYGLYIPSGTRVVLADDNDSIMFDRKNDPLPWRGCVALPLAPVAEQDCYLPIVAFRQRSMTGKGWQAPVAGELYEIFFLQAAGGGLSGDRRYGVIDRSGYVQGCAPSTKADPVFIKQTSYFGGIALQLWSDRRHCWAITAQEKLARADIGCTQEEIKSLLYARNLPMTATGRKRPVLHLVESHRRRIKNGTDIDITAFLRGVQRVEFGGTLFTVRPPEAIRQKVSERSEEKYYAA